MRESRRQIGVGVGEGPVHECMRRSGKCAKGRAIGARKAYLHIEHVAEGMCKMVEVKNVQRKRVPDGCVAIGLVQESGKKAGKGTLQMGWCQPWLHLDLQANGGMVGSEFGAPWKKWCLLTAVAVWGCALPHNIAENHLGSGVAPTIAPLVPLYRTNKIHLGLRGGGGGPFNANHVA